MSEELYDDLSDAQIESLKAALLALRLEMKGVLASTNQSGKPVQLDQAAMGRVSRIDAMQQQKMIAANRVNHEVRLMHIEAALEAIEAGTYGECKACEENIGYGRLKARPEAPLCLMCKSRSEKRRR